MRLELLLALLTLAAPARAAGDWLLDAERAAASAALPGQAAPEKPKEDWVPFEPASRLFRGMLPSEGWHASDEDDALGSIVRILGPEERTGALRALLTVRLVDRDSPGFVPAKEAVEAMRRSQSGRDATSVRPMRVTGGLARIFEVVETRRAPVDEGPSAPLELHQYVAVIPRGETYYLIRLVSARADYLDYRDLFSRFLKEFRPIGER